MRERGVTIDHSTLNRWVVKYAPECEKQFDGPPLRKSWRVEETYVKIRGKWTQLRHGLSVAAVGETPQL